MVYVDAKQELSFLDPPKLEIFSSVECLHALGLMTGSGRHPLFALTIILIVGLDAYTSLFPLNGDTGLFAFLSHPQCLVSLLGTSE